VVHVLLWLLLLGAGLVGGADLGLTLAGALGSGADDAPRSKRRE
jgi:hypothetical protein